LLTANLSREMDELRRISSMVHFINDERIYH